jgi:hypothetical protein
LDNYAHFVFMYPRSSSIELRDTPPLFKGEQNEIKTATSIGCIFYTQRTLYDLICIKSRSFIFFNLESFYTKNQITQASLILLINGYL